LVWETETAQATAMTNEPMQRGQKRRKWHNPVYNATEEKYYGGHSMNVKDTN
jgi:hypothetical protein